MKHYDFLIVGGGMTADAAVSGIREIDSEATVAVLTEEKHSPYFRPPLTKSLWQNKTVADIWCGTEQRNVDILCKTSVASIDPDNRVAKEESGETYSFGKLLLATGGTPKEIPGVPADNIIYYRNLDDYYNLRLVATQQEEDIHIGVVGAGFIGSEIAAALNMNKVQVTMIFPENGIGGMRFPADLSSYLNDYYNNKGINVLHGKSVAEVEKAEGKYHIRTSEGDALEVDAVVAGLGIKPRTELAENAGLEVDNGIKVNGRLQTSHPDIYAAGDVARFYNPLLESYIRVEHDDNTQAMGNTAGKNMAGNNGKYDYLPLFYSDLFDLGYEAVGETDSRLEISEHWQEFGKKGIVFYLNNNSVRGVVFWNVWDMVPEGRKLIVDKETVYDRSTLDEWCSKVAGLQTD